ncbi:MAG: hypothetical protein KDK28_08370, partial [Maritimibacter sp.]|nr:hypothetical protein [Maritimibacter sp.]
LLPPDLLGQRVFTLPEIPSLYMQSLIALGYCAARCDRRMLAREALEQAVLLDPTDRLGASWLLTHLNRDPSDES